MRFLKHAILAALLAAVPSALVVSAKDHESNIRGSGAVGDLPPTAVEDSNPVVQEDSTADEPEHHLPPKPKPPRRRGLPELVDGETPPLHPKEEAPNQRTFVCLFEIIDVPPL